MIKIFKDYKEFLNRTNKKINGVSQEWLDENNLTINTLNLVRSEEHTSELQSH